MLTPLRLFARCAPPTEAAPPPRRPLLDASARDDIDEDVSRPLARRLVAAARAAATPAGGSPR